jgi:hypothetical protein
MFGFFDSKYVQKYWGSKYFFPHKKFKQTLNFTIVLVKICYLVKIKYIFNKFILIKSKNLKIPVVRDKNNFCYFSDISGIFSDKTYKPTSRYQITF